MPFNALPLILGAGNAFGAFLSRGSADDAAREATQQIVQAQQEAGRVATNALQQGQQARAAGFETARGDVGTGTEQAINALQAGTSGAVGEQRDTLVRALEQINPELMSARGAQNLLNDALGVNGPEAQQQFFNQFQDDPGFQAELQDRINAVDRSAAARGQLFSGRTLQEVGDVGQRFRRGAFTDRLNRLRQAASGAPNLATSGAELVSGTGTNIANALLSEGRGVANLEAAQGTNLANLATRAGEAQAGGFENIGNVLAQQGLNIGNALARQNVQLGANEQQFINSLFGSQGAVPGAAAGLPADFLTFG